MEMEIAFQELLDSNRLYYPCGPCSKYGDHKH